MYSPLSLVATKMVLVAAPANDKEHACLKYGVMMLFFLSHPWDYSITIMQCLCFTTPLANAPAPFFFKIESNSK